MRILIDTNVLLSAALRDQLPERLILHVTTSDEFRWLVTPDILAEYVEVLRRPKFRLNDEVLRRWSDLLELRTMQIESPAHVPEFPRDPKDAPFLAAALAAKPDFLVTGDRDLLEAGHLVETRIVTVAAFCAEFGIS